jgi:hypothetical protein
VGLKVDADAVPDAVKQQIKDGKVNLDDPATTLALLKLDAVLGVKGFFDDQGGLKSIGLECAFCHSTVDDSFHLASVSVSTDGQTATSTSARLCRWRRISSRSRIRWASIPSRSRRRSPAGGLGASTLW